MTQHEQQVIKVQDYSDEVIREWLKVNGITELIPDTETVYVLNGVITARCFTTDTEKVVPREFPREELQVSDLYDLRVGRWELKETIQATQIRILKEAFREAGKTLGVELTKVKEAITKAWDEALSNQRKSETDN